MIKVVFLDLGETLIHDGLPFPGVVAALTALSAFNTAEGHPVRTGIVSNFHLLTPPSTEAKIAALEAQFRNEALEPSGLAPYFEPFESRVTISSRAGVSKPDKRIYEVALTRLGGGAALNECLFVTEDLEHLKKCREHGITPVAFGPSVAGMAGFEQWADAPAILARLIASGRPENLAAATAATLAVKHGLTGFRATESVGNTLHGRAQQLLQLHDERLGPLDGNYVERPSEVAVQLEADGRVAKVATAPLDADVVDDAVNFVYSLMKSRRVAVPGEPAPSFGVTHVVGRDLEGRAHLVRKRYSAR